MALDVLNVNRTHSEVLPEVPVDTELHFMDLRLNVKRWRITNHVTL